jgi:hypothetical protein
MGGLFTLIREQSLSALGLRATPARLLRISVFGIGTEAFARLVALRLGTQHS